VPLRFAVIPHSTTTIMHLKEFFSPDAISLKLEGSEKDEILKELITLLKLDEKSEAMLYKMLKRRENLGSTGTTSRSTISS
jgi:mannitol/fructose-specific phosphotransferase system IIA component (Ntr-type)